MRKSTLTRGGAALTAFALALTLGMGSASADDVQEVRAKAAPSASAPTADLGSWGDLPRAKSKSTSSGVDAPTRDDITKITISNGVMFQKGGNFVRGGFQYTPGTGSPGARAKSTIRVNGKASFAELYTNGLLVPNTAGVGSARVVSTRIYFEDGSNRVDTTQGNAFWLRSAVDTTATWPFSIKRVNKTVTFGVHRVLVFKPSTGTYVSFGAIRLQYKSGSSWKTLKTIKLGSTGSGTYKISTTSKRSYRIWAGATHTAIGFSTLPSDRI